MTTPAADHSAYLRGGVVEALGADAAIAALFPSRIYNREAPAAPAWPFVRVETPGMSPTEASGWVGGEVALSVHVFHKGLQAAEEVDSMARKVARLLDDSKVTLALDADETGTFPTVLELWHVRTQVLRDSESADAYHAAIEFTATTAAQR